MVRKKKDKNPRETEIVLSFMLLKHFLYGRFDFSRVVQLSLTDYLEWVVTPWMLKECTKRDNLQENTGLESGEMCWFCFTHDFGTFINLVTNMDDMVPHLLYKRLWKMLESLVSEYIKNPIFNFSFACSHCCWSCIDWNKRPYSSVH